MSDETPEEDGWFYNDALYLEYLLSLPKIDPARRGHFRYVKGIDLSKIRSEDA